MSLQAVTSSDRGEGIRIHLSNTTINRNDQLSNTASKITSIIGWMLIVVGAAALALPFCLPEVPDSLPPGLKFKALQLLSLLGLELTAVGAGALILGVGLLGISRLIKS
ncbi:MAG: hypothetical protein KR126chlam1_00317 [Chlamydiae bacterium]|nr:hypothetical protein [Chlamydiota bacterium]